MGNLKAESSLNPKNLQNTYEKKLGMNDETYTKAVDNGTYTNFVRDSAGYGLAQWTYWSRKQNLLEYAKQKKVSIGDLTMQIEFLIKEIKGYAGVWKVLTTTKSVREASDAVLLQYERPANQGAEVQEKRAAFGEEYYKQFAGGNNMGNSTLATYRRITTHKNSGRNHAIDTITPHCIVGQVTAQWCADYFATTDRDASSNYCIGKDGDIAVSVDESDRAWTSSNSANDNRAITIEIASDKVDPYTMTDAAYNALVRLCVDILKRHGKNTLVWKGSKDAAIAYEPKANEMKLTAHRFFANKSCPGDWLYSRYAKLAAEVTKAAGGNGSQETQKASKNTIPATPFTVQVLISDLNYRSAPSMSGAVRGQTGKGVFTITEVKDGWGKLKSGAGWIYLENPEYLSIGETKATEGANKSSEGYPATPFMVRVIIDDLNYRSEPSMSGKVKGQTGKGTFTITEVKNGWGKLKSGAGWIYLENKSYVTF